MENKKGLPCGGFSFCVIIGSKALFLVIIAGKGNRDEADGAEGGWESFGIFHG